jgi:hypothetical protein
MGTESKSNVIQFPLKKRLKDISLEEYFEKSNQYDDCVALARYCLDLMGDFMHQQDFVEGFKFDPEKDHEQYADLFIILNLLVASFLRSKNIRHILQDDLDELLIKIKFLESENFDPTKIK